MRSILFGPPCIGLLSLMGTIFPFFQSIIRIVCILYLSPFLFCYVVCSVMLCSSYFSSSTQVFQHFALTPLLLFFSISSHLDTPISPFPSVRQSAFSATVAGNLSDYGVAFTDYDAPGLNLGGDFDPVTGTFLVPMRGLYIFHVSATFFSPMISLRPVVTLSVNGVDRARLQARFDMTQSSKNVAVTIAQALGQGDTVRLVNLAETPNIDCSASFVGYLLS